MSHAIPVLTDKQVDTLTSYADGESRVRQEIQCSGPALREAGLNAGVEKCPGCGWWAETWEMIPVDADDPDGKCTNCRVSS